MELIRPANVVILVSINSDIGAVSNASPEALFKRVCSYDDNCFSVTGFSAGRYVRY